MYEEQANAKFQEYYKDEDEMMPTPICGSYLHEIALEK
jgi:hypothetical protein